MHVHGDLDAAVMLIGPACTLICDWDQNVRTLEVLQSNKNVAICACERESLYMYVHHTDVDQCTWSLHDNTKMLLIA